MKKIIFLTAAIMFISGLSPAYCAEGDSFNLTGIIESIINYQDYQEEMEKQDNIPKESFLSGVNNIYNGNIVVARNDFSKTIDNLDKNISLLMFSKKLYEYGFFTLGDRALYKIEHKMDARSQINLLKETYKPQYQLSESEENYLTKAYASIYYNNSPEEVAFNLIKKTNLLENSDYANYIMALSMFECKQYNQALIYVNRAIEKNNKNAQYKILKAKTLNGCKKYKDAIKYIEENEDTISMYFKNDLRIVKQQVLSNMAQNDSDKKFYQLYAYYLDGNYYKVLKETKNILSFYKNNPKILTLQGMAEMALGENKEAEDDFKLSYKQNKKFPLTKMGLADCDFIKENYKAAYNEYKKLISSELKNEAIIKSALSLEKINPSDKKLAKLNKQKEAIENKAFYEYYLVANNLFQKDEDKRKYLTKSLAINLLNKDSWDVAFKIDYKNSNYDNIDNIASILLYADDMNPEYYYYSALSLNHKNKKKEAFHELKKAVGLNPDYKPAVDMMNKLQNELI